MGMSYDDFCRCSPSEYNAIYASFEHTRRQDWERTRLLALCMIQPYSKKKLKLKDVMEFSWEHNIPEDADAWDEQMQGLSDAERFEMAKKKLGAKN